MFVGTVSRFHARFKTITFLTWLCKLPSPVEGIISRILLSVLLLVLMMLLRIVLWLLAKFE